MGPSVMCAMAAQAGRASDLPFRYELEPVRLLIGTDTGWLGGHGVRLEVVLSSARHDVIDRVALLVLLIRVRYVPFPFGSGARTPPP